MEQSQDKMFNGILSQTYNEIHDRSHEEYVPEEFEKGFPNFHKLLAMCVEQKDHDEVMLAFFAIHTIINLPMAHGIKVEDKPNSIAKKAASILLEVFVNKLCEGCKSQVSEHKKPYNPWLFYEIRKLSKYVLRNVRQFNATGNDHIVNEIKRMSAYILLLKEKGEDVTKYYLVEVDGKYSIEKHEHLLLKDIN